MQLFISKALSEGFAHSERTFDAIFMKPISPVGPTKMGSVFSTDLLKTLLSGKSSARVNGMMIGHLSNNFIRFDGFFLVKAHTKIYRRLKTLKTVHVVSQRDRLAGFLGDE
jgi:hypothetical protein